MKSKTITILLIGILASMLCMANTSIDDMVFTSRRISTADGLSTNTVYDIKQDKRGYVWMGAAYGLCRYDGYSFVNMLELNNPEDRKMRANIGYVYVDDENGLMWTHTATYTFACYDTHRQRFLKYTSDENMSTPYQKLLKVGSTMWMYDINTGIRCVEVKDGNPSSTLYNVSNGRLADNYVSRMVVDKYSTAWAATRKGLVMIRNHHPTVIHRGSKYIDVCVSGNKVLAIADGRRIETYNLDGSLLHSTPIPLHAGKITTIRSQIVCNGTWILFCGSKKLYVDIATGDATIDTDREMVNGMLLNTIDGYHFIGDKTGKLWMYTPKGELKKFMLIENTRFAAARNRKYNIQRDRQGLFYIASYGNGLFIYDEKNDKMRHFSSRDQHPIITNDFLLNLMIDTNGNIWVAQEASGISLISPANEKSSQYIMPNLSASIQWGNDIRMIAPSHNGNIIVSTRDNKLYNIQPSSLATSFISDTRNTVITSIIDRKGHQWKGTTGGGLFIDDILYTKTEPSHVIPTNDILDLVEDRWGRIWMASQESGLIEARLAEDMTLHTRQLLTRTTNEARLHSIVIDKNNRIWVSSQNGLYTAQLNKGGIENENFECFNTINGLLPYDEVRCLLAASDGCIWTGGKGSGVVKCRYDKGKLTYTVIDRNMGLSDNTVCALLEDQYGCIWASTENGLSRIYDNDMKVMTFKPGATTESNIFQENCCMKLKDGRLLFGTRQGLAVITPRKSYNDANSLAFNTGITDIHVNGKSAFNLITANNDDIHLSHNQNTLTIFFSNFQYANTEASSYQYYLEGADKTWRQPSGLNHADYSNLSPGTYTFHLRSMHGKGWGDEVTTRIIIAQPWYNSWWAWMIYLLVAVTGSVYVYHNAKERFKLNQQMKTEKEINEFRLNFFTNITHELRTPLAIISGAVDKMSEEGGHGQTIQILRRGTRRLMRQVNLLMEFRKINSGHMHLHVENTDIIAFVRNIALDFRTMAKQKDVNIIITPFERSFEIPIDQDMVETIVYNIISNAVKYSPKGSDISIFIKHIQGAITIAVEDKGEGIKGKNAERLFQPFMNGYASKGGMGIGLYTAHAMAETHKGCLTYEYNGMGSVFTLSLPDNDEAYTPNEWIDLKSKAEDTSLSTTLTISEPEVREMFGIPLNDMTIWVVEDDIDMMDQMISQLSNYFKIASFYDGLSAVHALSDMISAKPSLIITDVMLPDIDGYEVTKEIKGHNATASVPVIMLTALNDEKHQMKAYNAGADDYMVKPCNYNLLLARMAQLIKNHLNANNNDDNTPKVSSAEADATGPVLCLADRKFIDKVDMLISQHLDDPDFNIDKLANALCMGRTKLFGMAKKLLGMSPNKYIQNERMRVAAELLTEGELTVTEVSYRVGIQDPSYFNKCFKARYGVVPSKYKG